MARVERIGRRPPGAVPVASVLPVRARTRTERAEDEEADREDARRERARQGPPAAPATAAPARPRVDVRA